MSSEFGRLRQDLGSVTIVAEKSHINARWFGRMQPSQEPYLVGPLGYVTLGLWELHKPSSWASNLLDAARQVPGAMGEVQLASLLASPDDIPPAWKAWPIMAVTIRLDSRSRPHFVMALEAEGVPFGSSWVSASSRSEITRAPLVLVEVTTSVT